MVGLKCGESGVRLQELKKKESERLAENVTMKKRENGLKAKIERLKAKQSAK